jgi:hypothetical protein
MGSAAQNMYPNGPKSSLGNEDPDRILGGGSYADHLGMLTNGTDEQKEAFVTKYGYEHTISMINKIVKASKTDSNQDWVDSMEQFKSKLLSRQGS